ncbi:GNAT family N-acetyltransferase [Radiobacillus kanasensis]|uniref:GNAT family N-acetyltransferase n=1 Tax=Radiobacillus kanasensis TaxID=2844358 RepID=UPI001E4CAAB5|nr:GNAT family N-acetyltransferase [Radiobacillus kanasensis]UFT99013.1 GNAT family N-acetyltransferase [Radiobacillus kanasensis]
MRVIYTKDIKEFSKQIEPLLLRKESCNNLMLGILEREKDMPSEHLVMGLVRKGQQYVYGFLQTPPHDFVLPDIDVEGDVCLAIIRSITEQKLALPGIIGPRRVADTFVRGWEQTTNRKATVHMEQLIYQLDKVENADRAQGNLCIAGQEHNDLLVQWIKQFGKEANEPSLQDRAESLVNQFLENRSIYVWEVNGKPVSMANQSRKTKNGTTINAVYTPDEQKRKGYASACVAALSQKLLEEGHRFCALYTDQANPTSNRIYQKIGYKVVGDSIVYKLGE